MSAHIKYIYYKNDNFEELQRYFDISYIKSSCTDIKTRGGRGQTLLFTNKESNSLVLRHYFRGGLMGKCFKDYFFIFEKHAHRAFDEYNLLNFMYKNGLNVPKAIIAREISYGFYLRQDIVIEQIEKSNDLANIICERHLTNTELKNIGKCINKMFSLNIDHTDLNLRNILLDNNGKVYLIDFDKCYKSNLSFKRKCAILERLLRSFKKELVVNPKKCYFDVSTFQILAKSALSM